MSRLAWRSLWLVPVVGLVVAGPPALGHALFALGFRAASAPLMGDAGWRGYTLAQAGNYAAAAKAFGSAPVNAYNRGNALAKAGKLKQALDAYDAAIDADPEDEDARFNKALVAKILDTALTPPGQTKGNANAKANVERHHGGEGNEQGDTSSTGVGYTGNKEGSSNGSTQGGSKVSKIGRGNSEQSDSQSEKASGSAGQASGRGRSGSDLVDITMQLAFNQRRYSPQFLTQTVHPTVDWLQTVQDDPGVFLKLQIRSEQKRRLARADNEQKDDD